MDKWRNISAEESNVDVNFVKKRIVAAEEWRLQYIKSYVVGQGTGLLVAFPVAIELFACWPARVRACLIAIACLVVCLLTRGASKNNANFVPVQRPDD